jgi:peptide/nickel transport system permease protein
MGHSAFWLTLMRRASSGLLVIVVVVIITFILMHAAPGDPLDAIIGDYPVTPEYRAELRTRLALDKPLPEQLLAYFGTLAKGQLGYSFRYRQPVSLIILQRLKATLLLMGTSLALSTVIGILAGILAGSRPRSRLDASVMLLTSAAYSMPVFVLGIMLILIFSVTLKIFPVGGYKTASIVVSSGPVAFFDVAWHLCLPALALSARYVALLARVTRAAVLEVRSEDYVMVARAKGLSERDVLMRHIVRNALIPVATVAGMNFGMLLTGSAVLETVFGWPGMGSLMYDVMRARDFQVLQGIFLVSTATVVIANILTDMLYAKLDPRVTWS